MGVVGVVGVGGVGVRSHRLGQVERLVSIAAAPAGDPLLRWQIPLFASRHLALGFRVQCLDTSVTLGDISATTTALPRIEVRLVAILPHAAVALADAPLIVCYLAAPCVRPACYCSNPVTPQATRVPTQSTSRRGVWEAGRGLRVYPTQSTSRGGVKA